MANQIPGTCPFCGKPTVATRIECKHCHISIEGDFYLTKFNQLSEEQLKMVELFLVSRGSIKEMERMMGISYPTVRNKLEEIVVALGYPEDKEISLSRSEVLDKLDRSEITSEEAVNLLKQRRD